MKLANYVNGQWQTGSGEGINLTDPVTGAQLASVSSEGLDLNQALEFARQQGGTALRAMTYQARAELLSRIADTLSTHRDAYLDIALRNSGSTATDASFDIDGAIFTLKNYAKVGRTLGTTTRLKEGGRIPLAKTDTFQGQHFLTPLTGVAIFINAFNFPAWGLWEKAAPALLAGVPVLVKPATPTAWLTQRMVHDIVTAGLLPTGALNIVCGRARTLLDHVQTGDLVSFTGSADTAASIRTHPAVVSQSVRVNIEADSVNAAILGPDVQPDSAEFDLAVTEIIREMTIKAGQKCTAIRRILCPDTLTQALCNTVRTRLASMQVGNPCNPSVQVGPLINKTQQTAALEGIKKLQTETTLIFGGNEDFTPQDADPALAAFVQPTLLLCHQGQDARHVHDVEVFGPVATILPYASTAEAIALTRRGQGSLVASVYSADPDFLGTLVPAIADLHGRIMVIDASVGKQHTGHGNVMPGCLHGGPGRAGGGEEQGGLRALALYHHRHVIQGPPALLDHLAEQAADAALLYN